MVTNVKLIYLCRSDACLNGGTCVEGVGTLTSCNCMEGFDGDHCQNDLLFVSQTHASMEGLVLKAWVQLKYVTALESLQEIDVTSH